MRISLRMRLIIGVVIGTALLLGIFCVLVYTVTQRTLVNNFDNSLFSTAKLLSAIVEDEGGRNNGAKEEEEEDDQREPSIEKGKLEFEFDVRMLSEFNNLNGGGYYQFWDESATVFAKSPSLGVSDLPYFEIQSDEPVYRRCTLSDGKTGRMVSFRFSPRTEEDTDVSESVTLAVARDASDVYEFLEFFRWLLLGSSLIIAALSSYVAAKVSRIGLEPVHTLAAEIGAVDEQALEKSFSADRYPVELVPVCDCLNALMERIRSSFERERHFNSDVAHELRTPLAGIQSSIEVCLSRSRKPEEYISAMEGCLGICRTMNRLVNTLLALSRVDSGQVSFEDTKININNLIDDLWQGFADKAESRGLRFENLVGEDVCCQSDRDHLGMIISNVLDNAVEYCNEGGHICVKTADTGDSVVLSIANTGCDLAPKDVENVFDLFWREDTARADTGMHAGIGLAVVRKIAKALGVKVSVSLEQESVFTFYLEFPR